MFHNVSFKYPDTDVYVLKNISIEIRSSEKVAIVGMNGSGKTTFVKLLCRLYDPCEGYITLNGINIREYEYEEYQKFFGIIFQDFQLFSFSLVENIACSECYNSEKVFKSLHKVGFYNKRNKGENGDLNMTLFKDINENGVQISGGEGQKIAIARALYKEPSMYIMDEPTASLDPKSEYEIYSQMDDIVTKKGVIYISHRMASCRFSDIIYVIDKGRIIQKGNHNELMRENIGKYTELWNAQAKHYT